MSGNTTSSDFRARPFEWSSIICYLATLVLFIHLHVGTRTGTFWNESHWSDPSWAIMINHDQSWSIVMHNEQSWSIMSNQINHDQSDPSWAIMIVLEQSDQSWAIVIHHEQSWSIMSNHDQSWSCLNNQPWSIMISHNKPCWSSFDVITAKRLLLLCLCECIVIAFTSTCLVIN